MTLQANVIIINFISFVIIFAYFFLSFLVLQLVYTDQRKEVCDIMVILNL